MTAPMPETMSPREKVELKSCPFCGGVASLHYGMGEFWVRCDDCGSSGSMSSRRDRAERDWNDRPAVLASSGDHSGGVTDMVDHAELARLAEALKDDWSWRVLREHVVMDGGGIGPDLIATVPIDERRNYIAAANPATVLALIAEVAALRGEREDAVQVIEAEREDRELIEGRLTARATEAERKLAEAVGLLREWMGTWFVDADSREENAIADDTRKFLSKEAERG